ncbi:MAG: hypothetical protein KJN93_01515 [Alphaproteobacteria bacterium]|nr:hypothetical protein [Alphaproteobacteria bacterium]
MNWDERLALARERRAKVLERKAARAAERTAQEPGTPEVMPPRDPYETPPDLINEDDPSEMRSAMQNRSDISPLLRPFEPDPGAALPDAANEPGPVPPITPLGARQGTAPRDAPQTAPAPPVPQTPKPALPDRAEVQIETVLAPLRAPRRPFLRLATYAVLGLCVGLGMGFGLGALAPWLYTSLVPAPAATVATETARPAPPATESSPPATEIASAPAALGLAAPTKTPATPKPGGPQQTAAREAAPVTDSAGPQNSTTTDLLRDAAPAIELTAPAQIVSAAPERSANPVVDSRFVALSADLLSPATGPATAMVLTGPVAADTVFAAPAAPAGTQTGSEIAVLLDAPALFAPTLGGAAPIAPGAQIPQQAFGAPRVAAAAPSAAVSQDVAIGAPASLGLIAAPQITDEPAGLAPAPQRDTEAPIRLASAARTPGLAAPGSLAAPGRDAALPLPQGAPPAPAPQAAPAPASPAPATPQPAAQEPSGTGFEDLRVLLNAPASVTDASIAAATAELGDLGATPGSVTRVDFNVSQSQVRFFRAEDAAAARQMAETLGARARDFTDFRPSPPPGTIEVFLSGRAARPATAQTQRQPSQVDLLRQRLIRRLQRGEIVR